MKTIKTKKKTDTVVPFVEQRIEEQRSLHDLETGIMQDDLLKLSGYAYFLRAICDAFFAWDNDNTELTGNKAYSLLKPMADDFHHFVHVTLDSQRDNWDVRDRMKVLGTFPRKANKLAQGEGGAA